MLERPRPIQDPARARRMLVAILLVLLVSAGVRLWHLDYPGEYLFDEIYYAKDAKTIVDGRVKPKPPFRWEGGDEVSWPHPEAGKFAIAAGVLLFGDRAFGWRLPAVIAGMVILACVYPLGRRLGLPPPWAFVALLLAAADSLGIVQSRIATLDIFIAMWTVLCIYFALRYAQDGWRDRWLFACGLAGGLATSTKWSGGLALIAAALVILVVWMQQRRTAVPRAAALTEHHDAGPATAADDAFFAPDPRPADALTARQDAVSHAPAAEDSRIAASGTAAPDGPSALHRAAALVGALVIVPAVVYVACYAQYFAAGHTLADFRELHRQMLEFNLHLKATHSYASPSFTWILDIRPVWYYFKGDDVYRGIVAIGNPFLWWMATLSLVAAAVLALRHRSLLMLPAAGLVVVLYVPWFAATRTSFLYYMTPVAPFMAILVAAALCVLAGGVVPRRGWLAVLGVALATAVFWQPLGLLAEWLFWELPRRIGAAAGWMGVAVGILLALAAVAWLSSPRLAPRRPWMVMVLVGLLAGIVVAFIPVLLALPISPEYFSHITWFPSWV